MNSELRHELEVNQTLHLNLIDRFREELNKVIQSVERCQKSREKGISMWSMYDDVISLRDDKVPLSTRFWSYLR